MLSYMDSNCVDAWKEEQLDKLKEEEDEGIQPTDKTLWENFIERFKNAFKNQNCRSEAYQELCKLKQGDSLDDFFAKFKQLAHEADVPLDDKGTIKTLKHAMTQGLTSAIINSPNFDPTTKDPWTFCYDPGPLTQFSAIFHHLFRALSHLFPTRSLTRRSDRHQTT